MLFRYAFGLEPKTPNTNQTAQKVSVDTNLWKERGLVEITFTFISWRTVADSKCRKHGSDPVVVDSWEIYLSSNGSLPYAELYGQNEIYENDTR